MPKSDHWEWHENSSVAARSGSSSRVIGQEMLCVAYKEGHVPLGEEERDSSPRTLTASDLFTALADILRAIYPWLVSWG